MDAIASILKDGISAGELRADMDTHLAVQVLLTMIAHYSTNPTFQYGAETATDTADMILSFFFCGIGTGTGRGVEQPAGSAGSAK